MLPTLLALGAIALLVLTLLVKYMRRSTVKRVEISALQFLPELSQATTSRSRWQIGQPLRSPLFWVRFLFLALLVAALLSGGLSIPLNGSARLGVLIAVDQSPSMTVGEPSRLLLANQQAGKIAQHVATLGGCSRRIGLGAASDAGLASAIDVPSQSGLSPNAMGLMLSQGLADKQGCDWTHVVVLSDLPKPALFSVMEKSSVAGDQAKSFEPIWFQVGKPQSNRALTGASFKGAGFSGGGAILSVQISQYGVANGEISLVLKDPDGNPLLPVAPLGMGQKPYGEARYPVKKPGIYQAELREDNGLSLDNRLEISLGAIAQLPVRLDGSLQVGPLVRLVRRLGPVVSTDRDDAVHVGVYSPDLLLNKRGIYLVPSRGEGAGTLGYFDGASTLLEAVDLDLLEAMNPLGLARLPEGFRTIASGMDGRSWIAVRTEGPPAVLMPEPAGGLASDLEAQDELTWLVAFINAYRFVMADRQSLLDVVHVAPSGARLDGMVYESNTARPVENNPKLDDIQPVVWTQASEGSASGLLWPWLVLLAIGLLVIDRALHLISRKEAI